MSARQLVYAMQDKKSDQVQRHGQGILAKNGFLACEANVMMRGNSWDHAWMSMWLVLGFGMNIIYDNEWMKCLYLNRMTIVIKCKQSWF